MLTIVATIAIGLFLFASADMALHGCVQRLYGTSRSVVAIWRPEVTGIESLKRGVESAMMVVTLNDPPQFDWRALPVLAGAAAATLAVFGAPRFRDFSGALTLFFLACLGPAFFFRGWAYPGRFLDPDHRIACALAVCAASALVRRRPVGGLSSSLNWPPANVRHNSGAANAILGTFARVAYILRSPARNSTAMRHPWPFVLCVLLGVVETGQP